MRQILTAGATRRAILAIAAGFVATAALAEGPQSDRRVLSIGGSVTEIVYALGLGDQLVARDTTSIFPEAVLDLPDVGYVRALSAEGVLSVAPDLILSEEGAGPPEAIEALQAASIPFVTIPDARDGAGVVAKITAVGAALDAPEAAAGLAATVSAQFDEINTRLASTEVPKKVLFILSTQGGRILASGRGTAADAIIGLAGGINVLGGFEGYKPVTSEALLAAAPDVILMMDREGDHSMNNDDLFAMPALSTTPAAQTGAVVRMNGLYLLGFGPRSAQAALDLNVALYGG